MGAEYADELTLGQERRRQARSDAGKAFLNVQWDALVVLIVCREYRSACRNGRAGEASDEGRTGPAARIARTGEIRRPPAVQHVGLVGGEQQHRSLGVEQAPGVIHERVQRFVQ